MRAANAATASRTASGAQSGLVAIARETTSGWSVPSAYRRASSPGLAYVPVNAWK